MTIAPVLLLVLLLGAQLAPSPQAAPYGDAPARPEDYRTEQALQTTPHPPRDLYQLYPRLKGVDPDTLERVTGSTEGWRPGTTERFWVADLENDEYTERPATLRHVSENAYWFVENGRQYSQPELEAAAARFDRVVERNRDTFGSEWNPGVDNDPRMVILIASTPGAGGYFSSADEYPRSINPYSNEHEIIYIDSQPGDPYFDSTLAHEFQHMIHWNEHANQDVWLNEGMAEYAVELNGYRQGLPEQSFAANPDVQLNTWTDSPSSAAAHYGQAYRFMSYLAGRFGPDIMSAIVEAPGTGLGAVDHAIRSTQPGATLQQVYADWLVANLLMDDEGRFGYADRMTPVQPRTVDLSSETEDTVEQWGADYYLIGDDAPFTISFEAAPRVKLVDNDPKSGTYQWYSNRGDLLDTTLTRKIDLSGVPKATLELDLWYDIEEHFDYAYVEVSTDGGETWTTLPGRRTTNDNPNGNNLGNGITGNSDGWVTERFDLSPYAGREVLLRIEYVTDDGYNAQGLAVDGVRVPEVGFADDSENPNGWQAQGWVRTNNWVPGRYRLLVVDPSGEGSYTEIPVGADGQAYATFPTPTGEPPVVVVGGAAETTTLESPYRLEVTEAAPGGLALIGGRGIPLAP